jgi:hypothetical protein
MVKLSRTNFGFFNFSSDCGSDFAVDGFLADGVTTASTLATVFTPTVFFAVDAAATFCTGTFLVTDVRGVLTTFLGVTVAISAPIKKLRNNINNISLNNKGKE